MTDVHRAADHSLLGELFEKALTLPPAARPAFVDNVCRDRPDLHTELKSLLGAYAKAPAHLERLAEEALPAVLNRLPYAPFPIGRSVAHYEIQDLIGSGGMGVVYKARDSRLERPVALKFLWPHLTGHANARARLEREARAASALDHANIGVVYEIASVRASAENAEAERLFIAMAYYAGTTLREKIARGPLSVDEALDYARQVADGLARAHEAGIVHRDIKPANLIVTHRGEVKIVDFGLAKCADSDLTRDAVTQGTVAYMSPEQTRGDPVDHRSDIWSLGAVLYEMLAGTRAFRAADDTLLIHAIRHDDPEPLLRLRPEVPAELGRVAGTCLAKDPGKRYPRVVDLLAALRAIETRHGSDSAEAAISINEAFRGPASGGHGASPLVAVGHASPRGPTRAHAWAPPIAVAAVVLAVGVGVHIARSTGEDRPVAAAHRLITNLPGTHILPTFSPDGSMLAFNSLDSGTWQIWVQSLAGGAPIQVTHVDGNATEPAWSPFNDRIAFSRVTPDGDAAGIWSIDPLGATQPRKISDTGFSPSFSWDARSIVYSYSGAIWIVNADGTGQRAVPGAESVSLAHTLEIRPAFSPDGGHIAYFGTDGHTPLGDIWGVPSTGGEPRRLTFERAPLGGPAWTADGRFIIYPASHGGATNLWSVPFSGGDPRPVTAGAGEHLSPAVSRDGRFLLYASRRRQWELTRTDPVTGAHDVLLRRRNSIYLPQVSPDGELIAYFSELASGIHLFTVGSDGGDVRQLTFGDGHQNVRPTWSSDGRSLLFYEDLPSGSLRRQPLDGGPSAEVLAGFRETTHSAARESPLGDAIAFTRVEAPGSDRQSRTVILNLGTGAETELDGPIGGLVWSTKGDRVLGTRWDADGNYIVICPTSGGPCDVPTDGGNPIRGRFPQWSSDGSRIYFARSAIASEISAEVWEVEPDGSNARKVLELSPPDGGVASARFQITPDDHIVWSASHDDGTEIWSATLGN